MVNEQLEYYLKHNISPEHQDISDLKIHFERREKLYRQCGIPGLAFRNAEILEVGPGGGDNTLAFFHWNCKHIDLVEANPTAIKDMRRLFTDYGVPEDKYQIYNCIIEKYNSTKKYDIIVAEGFIQHISNQKEVLDKLIRLIRNKGIIIITCGGKINFFIEIIKRMVGRVLTKNIPSYVEKVEYLTKIFAPQLAQLRGVSKLPEDWVKDNIFNPELNSESKLDLMKAIRIFDPDFDVLGCSPQIFTDYSWSKDIWYDYKQNYIEQFQRKRLSLLMANMPEIIAPVESVNDMLEYFENIINIEREYERTPDVNKIGNMLDVMEEMERLVYQYMPDEFVKVFFEIKDVLICLKNNDSPDMRNYPNFFKAFGRTQQYISFVKK